MRALLVSLGQAVLSLGLLAWLVHDVRSSDPETFRHLLAEPKRWHLLVAAWLCFLLALGAGLARWHRLARAVGLACSAPQALRIGVLAYTLDFVALGVAGGDLFKALSLRSLHPGHGARALTTVVADRLVGLGSLLLFAGGAAWMLGATTLPGTLPALARLVFAASAAGIGTVVLLLALRRRPRELIDRARRLPLVGRHVANLLDAVALYASSPGTVAQAVLLSIGVHSLNITGFALLAAGLSANPPDLAQHFLIVPLASFSGLVPLPADTLGVLDYAMSYLYEHVTAGGSPASLGLLVAMTYRVVGIVLTSVGLAIYWYSPGSVRQLARSAARSDDGAAA